MSQRKPPRRYHDDIDAPEADALEQSLEWADQDPVDTPRRVDADVSEFDALDQARPAPLDDEEHE